MYFSIQINAETATGGFILNGLFADHSLNKSEFLKTPELVKT